jgi:hypothetical protein
MEKNEKKRVRRASAVAEPMVERKSCRARSGEWLSREWETGARKADKTADKQSGTADYGDGADVLNAECRMRNAKLLSV